MVVHKRPNLHVRQTMVARSASINRQRAAELASALIFFFCLNWFILFSGQRGVLIPDSNLGHQSGYIVALGLTVFAFFRSDLSFRDMAPPASVLLALGWCWLSTIWAIDQSLSIRRMILTTIVVVVLFATTQITGYRKTLSILRKQMVIALALSYIFIVIAPDSAIQMASTPVDSGGASWRGIFVDKNICGAFCATMVLTFFFDTSPIKLTHRVLAIAAALLFLVMSESKTSMGILAMVMPFGLTMRFFGFSYRALIALAVPFLLIAFFVLWDFIISPFQQALQDPRAFTGRGPIWATLLRFIDDNWLLGSGYGSFWGTGSESPAFRYTNVRWVQTLSVGHNGYLDTLAQVGIIGLCLVLFAMIIQPLYKIFLNKNISSAESALLCSYILFSAGNNLMESTLFDRDAFLNVIMVTTIALIAVRDREGSIRKQTLRSAKATFGAGKRVSGVG